jgi:hypothetical protein
MSTEQDKFKHSRRLLKDDNAINKQLKIAKTHGSSDDKNVKNPHRLVKQHAMDCGNPRCLLCSREKVFGEPTIQQKRFDQNVEEPRDRHSNGLPNQEDLS